ncbi:MAG: phage integrase N-terminal SAM-like domain-containing protein [Desulforhopalus sp.]
MKDINDFNSADFGRFLLESNLVGSGKEKFMVYWVRKFFEFRVTLPKMFWPEQLPLYLNYLNASGVFKDWQIRQADQAVRLYFSNFLMLNSSPDKERESFAACISTERAALQNFHEGLRLRNYAVRTEKTYAGWVRRYFDYCKTRTSPADDNSICTPDLVRDFLAYLVVKRNVSASTQNLAFNSLLIFFRFVFNTDIGDLKNAVRAKTGQKLPVVFSVEETGKILQNTKGMTGLMLKLIYGGGLRVNECCRLRIKDIDFDQQLIFVRDGKGGKDRSTLLPASLNQELHDHISRVFALHDRDLSEGYGSVRYNPTTSFQ